MDSIQDVTGAADEHTLQWVSCPQ